MLPRPQRWGRPDDVAAPAAFLCSDESDSIQGQTLMVNGGWRIGKGF